MQDPQGHKRSYSARAMNCDQSYHLPSIHGKTFNFIRTRLLITANVAGVEEPLLKNSF